MKARNKNLGKLLVEKGHLTPATLDAALTVQQDEGNELWDVLIEHRLIGEQSIRMILEENPDLPTAQPKIDDLDPQAFKLVPLELCRRYCIFPMEVIRDENGRATRLTLAAADPEGNEGVERIVKTVGRPAKVVAALREDIEAALEQAETISPSDDSSPKYAMPAEISAEISKNSNAGTLLEWIFETAPKLPCGALHIKKRKEAVHVQDMDCLNLFTGPASLYAPLLSLLREKANISDGQETVLQKGHINFPGPDGLAAMFRLSVFLGVDGHEIQLKALPVEGPTKSLSALGFSACQSLCARKALEEPGLTLVVSSAPEGLGTTLFSLLRASPKKGKAITIEDEIMYRSPEFLQIEIGALGDKDISAILKEIKFLEFRKVLINAATHSQMRDLLTLALKNRWAFAGIIEENFKTALKKIADDAASLPLYGLKLLIHQKFVPLLCPDCRIPCTLGSAEQHAAAQAMDELAVPYQAGDGCPDCGFKGVKGYRAFFELLPVTGEVRNIFHNNLKGEQGLDSLTEQAAPSIASQMAEAVNRGEIALSSLWEAM